MHCLSCVSQQWNDENIIKISQSNY
jgi:hypothetical protein